MSACSKIIDTLVNAVRKKDFSGFDMDPGDNLCFVVSTGYAVLEFQIDALDEVYMDINGARFFVKDAFPTSSHSFMLKFHNKIQMIVDMSEE